MNKEEFLSWFNSLPKKEKIIIIVINGDDSLSISELRKMSIEKLLEPNILGYDTYEHALKDIQRITSDDIDFILSTYNKKGG